MCQTLCDLGRKRQRVVEEASQLWVLLREKDTENHSVIFAYGDTLVSQPNWNQNC